MIDLSPKKYIVLLDTGTPGTNREDTMRSRGGTQSFDTQGVHPRLKSLPQMYRQVSAKSIEKGYKFLRMDTRFYKNS